jgi:hypothetical protein
VLLVTDTKQALGELGQFVAIFCLILGVVFTCVGWWWFWSAGVAERERKRIARGDEEDL